MKAKWMTPVALVVLYTILIFVLLKIAGSYPYITLSDNHYLNFQANYQPLLVGLSSISLLTTYLINKTQFKEHFKMGNVAAKGKELKWFAIKKDDNWIKTGLSLCLLITSVTAIFMYFQVRQTNPEWSTLPNGILWITLFSLTNSFGEEMIYRLGVVSPLKGRIAPGIIFFISAILFALPHFAGMPNGIIGATMAGILGYVLAKSIYETKGFFWAWTIHFLQDVVIMGTLFLMSNNGSR